MHDRTSTFFVLTTRNLIGLDSKTAKKLRVKVHFVCFLFFKVSSNLGPSPTTLKTQIPVENSVLSTSLEAELT